MDRRRFLKYTGASAVVVGASALGFDYLSRQGTPVLKQATYDDSVSATAIESNTPTESPTLSGSYTRESATVTSPTRTGPVTVWESGFAYDAFDGFRPATLDASVNCPSSPNYDSDVVARVVDDPSAPTAYGRSLELVANVNRRKGIFVNGITARSADFIDDCKWYGYGFFKKSGQIQNVGVNLHLVEDYVARSALFAWILNRYDDLYQWVVLNVAPDDEAFDSHKAVRIVRLRDDENWHYFEIEGEYTSSPRNRTITCLRIDDAEQEVRFDMPRFHQAWKSSFDLYLETNNFWTNCDPNISTQGVTHWSKVGLVREPPT